MQRRRTSTHARVASWDVWLSQLCVCVCVCVSSQELFLGLMLSDVESVEHILCEKVTSTPMLTWPTASQLLELATLARGTLMHSALRCA